jgi:hypothetical protein
MALLLIIENSFFYLLMILTLSLGMKRALPAAHQEKATREELPTFAMIEQSGAFKMHQAII